MVRTCMRAIQKKEAIACAYTRMRTRASAVHAAKLIALQLGTVLLYMSCCAAAVLLQLCCSCCTTVLLYCCAHASTVQVLHAGAAVYVKNMCTHVLAIAIACIDATCSGEFEFFLGVF